MLPFLKRKEAQASSIVLHKDLSQNKPSEVDEQPDPSAAIEACARHLLLAVEAKDVKAIADALSNAFEVLEAMPHEESSEPSPHSYDAQNIIAGENE